MTKVMTGVRVLEVAQFTFVPMAGGILAEWGADVIKIEHPVRGDTQRGFKKFSGIPYESARAVMMQHPNRGKRSVGLDIGTPEGLELLYEMAAQCDVFLTNFLPSARRKLKIDVEQIRAANPNIIYVRGTALGDHGPERENGGFDSTAFWARGGSAMSVTPPQMAGPLTQPGPAYGDTIGGMNIAGGISAALFHREKTGEALEIDVSLLASGMWATAASIAMSADFDRFPFPNDMPGTRKPNSNPFAGVFMTSDGGAINLSVLTPGEYIEDTFAHVDLPELATDPRFSTIDALLANGDEAFELIKASFAKQTFKYWNQKLKTLKGQWSPYQNAYDVLSDEQALANGFIFEVDSPDDSGPIKLVANPIQFNRQFATNTRAPEASEHTELVLMDMGIDWDRIEELKAKGAIA